MVFYAIINDAPCDDDGGATTCGDDGDRQPPLRSMNLNE